MSEVLDDIGTRIATVVSAASYALDKADWRDDTDKRVCIFEYAGTAPQRQFGQVGAYYKFPQVQVCVRGEPTDYNGPYAVIKSIYDELMTIGAQALASGKVYHLVTPVQEPFPLRRDDRNRWEWACNFRVEKRATV